MYSYPAWCEEAARNRIDAITTVWNLALRSVRCTDHAGLNASLAMLDNLHESAKMLLKAYSKHLDKEQTEELEKAQTEEEKANGITSSH